MWKIAPLSSSGEEENPGSWIEMGRRDILMSTQKLIGRCRYTGGGGGGGGGAWGLPESI